MTVKDAPVGRLLLDAEREARRAAETATAIRDEFLRSAFAISGQHVLSAWHCVSDQPDGPWWWRVWVDGAVRYVPVALVNHDVPFDVAVLGVDETRLDDAGLTSEDAAGLLAAVTVPLAVELSLQDEVQVKGYPANASSAHHDTITGRVVDLRSQQPGVAALKLGSPALEAIDPLNPRGMSGGPVLRVTTDGDGPHPAVGLVRSVPRGRLQDTEGNPITALGGSVFATRIEDVASVLPEVGDALVAVVPPVAHPRRVGSSLTALLRADAETVAFFGRTGELAALQQWAESEHERAAWLITGPGGQGKTRLALHFGRHLANTGRWVCTLVRGPEDLQLVRDVAARARAAGRSLMLVVDYAAEYGAPALTDLADALTGDEAPQWRILLLARATGDWWSPEGMAASPTAGVRDRLLARGVVVPERELALAALVPHAEDRAAVFVSLVEQLRPRAEAFAQLHDLTVASAAIAPDMTGADFGSALLLHVAAVTSLLPAAGHPRQAGSPASARDLFGQVIDLECRHHWLYADADAERLYSGVAAAFGDLLQPAHRHVVVETAVAAATLAGAVHRREAEQLIKAALGVDTRRAGAIAAWLHALYPAAPSEAPSWLPPLQPDRLGEELIARVIRREQADGLADGDLLPHRIVSAMKMPGTAVSARQAEQAITVLVRIGARDASVASLLANGHTGVVDLLPPEVDLATALGALPHHRNTHLLPSAAIIAERAIQRFETLHPGWRDADSTDPALARVIATGAWLLRTLGRRRADAGRPDEATAPSAEATLLYRRLAETNTTSYLPDLAGSLSNLSDRLAEVGRSDEALTPGAEATLVYHVLASTNPTAYLNDLAASLNNLSLSLAEIGRREEALARTQEAVTIRRRLVETNPEYLPDLAGSLSNLSNRLAELGHSDVALTPAKEAVALYRKLAESNPAPHLPDLAGSLSNLASRLAELGRHEDALPHFVEAIGLQRGLSATNSAAYAPDLATSLNNLGLCLASAGCREDALPPTQETVAIRRRLAETNPAAHIPALASSLKNLGLRLADLGRREDALAPAEEAVTMYRGLAEAAPAVYLPHLARSLWAIGWISVALAAELDRGLEAAVEACSIYSPLADREPAAFAGFLVAATRTRADLVDLLGRRAEADELRRHLDDNGD